MSINGYKNRILQRRGLLETQSEKSLLFEKIKNSKIEEFCTKDKFDGVYDSINCEVIDMIDDLPPNLRDETENSINNIYEFFLKQSGSKSKPFFTQTLDLIMGNENPANSFKLISKFLTDSNNDDKLLKVTLSKLLKSKTSVFSEKDLEEFLRKIRFKEYSKYEESFIGDHFNLRRGRSVLTHELIEPKTNKPYKFINLVNMVYEGRIELDYLVDTLYNGILNTNDEQLLYKADLDVVNDLKHNGVVIVPSGSYLEVKKIDYNADTHFSEYYSIYKNNEKLPLITETEEFKNVYNSIIDSLFNKLLSSGSGVLKRISENINGIMYDDNILVLNDDLEFYWSNKGQRGCNERRLSVRVRVKNEKIKAYIYDKKDRNNQLTPVHLSVNLKEKMYC
jgi:hypothetical protein